MYTLSESLKACTVCPHQCQIDRSIGLRGKCRAGVLPKLALASVHHWEEPCISGDKGSGTIFFSHCNLKCIYCQNYTISQHDYGQEITIPELSALMIKQQSKGVHNINLVSAAQFLPQVREALLLARQSGLHIPVVYNSNGYESVESLQTLEGLIDIYLPDFKYYANAYGELFSRIPLYCNHATTAILEMYRQVGIPRFDEQGILIKGLIIRHLVLPGCREDSKNVLLWIKDHLPVDVYVSLLAQYTPVYEAHQHKQVARRITTREYQLIVDYFFEIGLKNGYVQERSSATSSYTPSFDLSGI